MGKKYVFNVFEIDLLVGGQCPKRRFVGLCVYMYALQGYKLFNEYTVRTLCFYLIGIRQNLALMHYNCMS